MNLIQPNEKILFQFEKAGYEIPGHNKYWRFFLHIDKGILMVTDQRILFVGNKGMLSIDIENILDLSTRRAIGIIGVDYVRVIYQESDFVQEALFLPRTAPYPVWKIRRQSDDLFRLLIKWHHDYKNSKKK